MKHNKRDEGLLAAVALWKQEVAAEYIKEQMALGSIISEWYAEWIAEGRLKELL